jgi:hypothetical protein
MRRLSLAMIVTSFGLHAAPMTFVSCTLGTTTQTFTDGSSCFIPAILDGMQVGFIEGDASASESLSSTGGTLEASAAAGGILNQGDFTASATASASDSLTLFTSGPPRLGLIQFDMTAASDNGAIVNVDISDGVHNYVPINSILGVARMQLRFPSTWGRHFRSMSPPLGQHRSAPAPGVQTASPQ